QSPNTSSQSGPYHWTGGATKGGSANSPYMDKSQRLWFRCSRSSHTIGPSQVKSAPPAPAPTTSESHATLPMSVVGTDQTIPHWSVQKSPENQSVLRANRPSVPVAHGVAWSCDDSRGMEARAIQVIRWSPEVAERL